MIDNTNNAVDRVEPELNAGAESVANDGEATTVPSSAEDAAPESCQATAPAVPPLMTGGGNVSAALPNRPRTLKEASDLAKKYFE